MPKLNPYLIKENYKQVEEVRELENTEQQQKPTITESIKEAVLPVAHASDKDEKQKEGVKNIIGGVSSATGGVASVPLKVVGKTAEGIGQASDVKGLEEAGKIYSEGTERPKEWVKELFK
jgi:uncharacterized linocin/CFP29 family protein